MRTFEKTWHAKYQNIDILVHNFWNFERTGCWININGRQVYHNEKRIESASSSSLLGEYLEFEENGTKDCCGNRQCMAFFGCGLSDFNKWKVLCG